jgi:hypothetical protein
MLNKNLQEINIQNMDVELVAQMFKNYQSNVLFHLEGQPEYQITSYAASLTLKSYKWPQRSRLRVPNKCWPMRKMRVSEFALPEHSKPQEYR